MTAGSPYKKIIVAIIIHVARSETWAVFGKLVRKKVLYFEIDKLILHMPVSNSRFEGRVFKPWGTVIRCWVGMERISSLAQYQCRVGLHLLLHIDLAIRPHHPKRIDRCV